MFTPKTNWSDLFKEMRLGFVFNWLTVYFLIANLLLFPMQEFIDYLGDGNKFCVLGDIFYDIGITLFFPYDFSLLNYNVLSKPEIACYCC